MKKVFILSFLFFSLSLLFFSCKKDDVDQENGNFEELIIGEWRRTSETIGGEISQESCIEDMQLIFEEDGTYSIGNYPVGSNCAGIPNGGPYTINGSVIEMRGGLSSADLEIITLNTTNLVYSSTNSLGLLVVNSYDKF